MGTVRLTQNTLQCYIVGCFNDYLIQTSVFGWSIEIAGLAGIRNAGTYTTSSGSLLNCSEHSHIETTLARPANSSKVEELLYDSPCNELKWDGTLAPAN